MVTTRRSFLHAAGGVAAAALLVGCESASPAGDAAIQMPSPPTGPPASGPLLLQEVAAGVTSEVQVINASFEQLVGSGQPFAFGIVGADNTPVRDAEVEVWLRPREGEPAVGPVRATFHDIPGQQLGIYLVDIDLPVEGAVPWPLCSRAVTGEGRPCSGWPAPAPPPGRSPGRTPSPSPWRPTTEDEMDFERLCPQDPPCEMHEVSLQDALEAGRPVMLTRHGRVLRDRRVRPVSRGHRRDGAAPPPSPPTTPHRRSAATGHPTEPPADRPPAHRGSRRPSPPQPPAPHRGTRTLTWPPPSRPDPHHRDE